MAESRSKEALVRERRRANERIVGSTYLLWLSDHVEEDNGGECRAMITELERLINQVQRCSDSNFFQYLFDTNKSKKLFLIIPGYFGEEFVPKIHDKNYLVSIYILCGNKSKHEKWAKNWAKVKGVFTDISLIYDELRESARNWEENTPAISFTHVSSRGPEDREWEKLENLKEALVAIEFEDKDLKDFFNEERESSQIRELEHEYSKRTAIWWYTHSHFLSLMLNTALRTGNIDRMIKMGFFIRDLDREIKQLHVAQFTASGADHVLTVYRGQGLSQMEFKKLTKNKGNFIIFHSFISMDKDRAVSLTLAEQATTNVDLTGILFKVTTNPDQSATRFASIGHLNPSRDNNEVLFSMNAICRIIDIQSINNNNRLYEVHLELLNIDDRDLHRLNNRRQLPALVSFFPVRPRDRLCRVLTGLAEFDKAEQISTAQLNETKDDNEKGRIYQELACNKFWQGQFASASEFYEKAIATLGTSRSPNQLGLAEALTNTAHLYQSSGDFTKALSYQEKALTIQKELLPRTHPDLARSFDILGGLYQCIQDYGKARSSYETALDMREHAQPRNLLGLADSYDRFGSLNRSMKDYTQALSFYNKAMHIREQTLPNDHVDLAKSYKSLARTYLDLQNVSEARHYNEMADQIRVFDDDSEEYLRMMSA